jgi:hypothetical protein
MKLNQLAGYAVAAAVLSMPFAALAQESHEDAVAQTHAHDAKHHTKAKIVGGSAVGGAVVGGATAGPVGAVVGGAAGAGGGLVANKIRKHHAIKKREETATPDYPR